jgi:hypothetical protein
LPLAVGESRQVAGADLAALGSLGIACWGWLLAPVLRAVPAWSAVSTALLSGSAALAGGAAAAVFAGAVAGCAAHLGWRRRLMR